MITLGADALARFPRFTLYNSPYISHREGRAIDLYPDTETAPSPVAGEVRTTQTMACPSRPYASETDYLIVIDTGDRLARILHVDPAVEPGDTVAIGDPLGRLVRSGYFARWVDNHVHLGFREYGTDPVRASGSLRLGVDVHLGGTAWDGSGTVVETGDTYAILDGPTHPSPGERYVGITDNSGEYLLDGGLPHYENGGVTPIRADPSAMAAREEGGASPGQGALDHTAGSITLLGTRLGPVEGRELHWTDVTVVANGTEITGLSFFLGREEIYAKLITPDVAFTVGDQVDVSLSR